MKGEGRPGNDPVDRFSPERAEPRTGAPMSKGSVIDQSLPAQGPACAFDHIGLEPCLINESQALQLTGHIMLAISDPEVPLACNVRPLLFNRLQVFFCV